MADNSSIPKCHLLPCNIDYDGPAPISNYFQVNASHDEEKFISHFRGRKLVGSKVDCVASPFKFVTAVTKQSKTDTASKTLEIQSTIDSFIQWGHDVPSTVAFCESYNDMLEISQAVRNNIHFELFYIRFLVLWFN